MGNRWVGPARELGVSEGLFYKLKKEAIESASDSEREIIGLKERLREVEMGRDNLTKAALIFGRNG